MINTSSIDMYNSGFLVKTGILTVLLEFSRRRMTQATGEPGYG